MDLKKTPTLAPAGVSRTSKLYRNNGDRTFTEVSHAAGVDFTLPIISAAAPDLDRDGYPDLVITGVGVVESYLNLGDGGFRAWTGRIETHVPPDSVAASTSFGDLDLDGDLDGFVSVYSHMDREQLEARLLIMRVSNSNYPTPVTNNPLEDAGEFNILLMDQDGHMVDRTASMLPDGGRRRGRSFLSVMADLVDQGRPQILVSNDLSACNLYVQGQDGSYVDRAQDYWIADGRSNMGMAVADPDNDGDLDLFVTHWCRQLSGLFENLQPKPIFSDMALKVGIEKTDPEEVGWGANFVDLDLDGDLDLFVVNGHTQAARYDPETCFTTDKNLCVGQKPLVLISQDGRYKNRSDEVGLKDSTWIGRSTAAFDLDLDGDLDFIIGNNNTPAVLLETVQTAATEAGPSKNWISVELVGTQNNRQGIGARVTCSIPDDAAAPVRLREVVMGSSYLSQETLRSHFGLGRADHVTITVRWPGGQTQVIEHVRTNQILRVVEAS